MLQLPLHRKPESGTQPTSETGGSRQVAYVVLSPPKMAAGAKRISTSASGPSAKSNGSRPGGTTVVDTMMTSTEPAGSPKSLRGKRSIDPRVFRPGLVERSQTEIVDSIIRAGIQPGNDSAARMRRALQNAVDWTVAVNGDRYGMSPGRLHVGKISIRFPLVFAEPLSLAADRRRELRGVGEDARAQASRAIRDAMFDSAVASITLRRLSRARPRNNSGVEPERK